MEEASAIFLSKNGNGVWNFGFCRNMNVSKLSAAVLPSDILSFNQEVPGGHFELFKHDVAIQVLHDFMDMSVTASASSEAGSLPVKERTSTLANLNAYVDTVITCLRADGFEKVVAHRQKLYNDTFSSFLLIALAQLVYPAGAYVELRCPKDVTVSPLSINRLRRRDFVRHFSAQSYSRAVYSFDKTMAHRRFVSVVFRMYDSWHWDNP